MQLAHIFRTRQSHISHNQLRKSGIGMDQNLQKYYSECYSDVTNSGMSGRVQRLFHMGLEKPFGAHLDFQNILEVGASNAEHLRYVKHSFRQYTMVDINDSPVAREEVSKNSNPERDILFMVDDAELLSSIDDSSVDRLISMCLLHHLREPDRALVRWRTVVRSGGRLSIFLPCDPGILWRLGRGITTFRRAHSLGYTKSEIRFLNSLDHRNHFPSLLAMVKEIFAADDVQIQWRPWPKLKSWNFNLYVLIQIIKA